MILVGVNNKGLVVRNGYDGLNNQPNLPLMSTVSPVFYTVVAVSIGLKNALRIETSIL